MHFAERVLHVHLADKQATISSVGVIYGLLIAAQPTLGPEEWRDVHAAIRARFSPADDRAWLRLSDKVKAAGWRLHDALARTPPPHAETPTGKDT